MPRPRDRDPHLDSMQQELRAAINALNELYHPVYPADEDRIAEYEARVAELREAIAKRRDELASANHA